ncbi:MAG: electron transport complex subunit RsxE, partial [Pseudomonadales bacterium]
GAMREVLGAGTLFADMHLLFGPIASNWKVILFEDYVGFLFAILPPGAFVGLGLIIAAKNAVDEQLKQRKAKQPSDLEPQPLTLS